MLHVLWLTQFLYLSSEAIPTDEQRLLDKLLKDYNPASRPVYNASDTVTVRFGITLTQLSDMVSVDYFHYFSYICCQTFCYLIQRMKIRLLRQMTRHGKVDLLLPATDISSAFISNCYEYFRNRVWFKKQLLVCSRWSICHEDYIDTMDIMEKQYAIY